MKNPPAAAQRPEESVIHGGKRVDEYAWLRDFKDPEVQE
jgi:protease II